MSLYGVMWRDVVWCRMSPSYVLWFGVVRRGMAWCGVVCSVAAWRGVSLVSEGGPQVITDNDCL